MKTELNTNELFNLLISRYNEYIMTGAKACNDIPLDAKAHNAVIATLKDFVENFSEGRLEVTTVTEKYKEVYVSCKEVEVRGEIKCL